MSKSVSEIITALGGPKKVATAIRHNENAVSVWKHRAVIPRRWWPDLIDAFPETIDLETLRATERTQ